MPPLRDWAGRESGWGMLDIGAALDYPATDLPDDDLEPNDDAGTRAARSGPECQFGRPSIRGTIRTTSTASSWSGEQRWSLR